MLQLSVLGFAAVTVSTSVHAEEVEVINKIEKIEIVSDASDEDITGSIQESSSVGKLDAPIKDQPFSMSVIDDNFIKSTGAKNIQDALLYTSGVYSGSFGFDTRGDWAQIRGLDSTRYLDGLRDDYGSYNSVRVNPYTLEKIEVLKGPSSTLYGQGGLGGTVNLVSKTPKKEFAGEVGAQIGNFNRKQLSADVTGIVPEHEKLQYRLVALYRDSETQVDHVDNDGYVVAPSLTWNASENTDVTFMLNHQQNKGGVSAQFLPQAGTLDRGSQGFIDPSTFVGEPGWDRYDRKRTDFTVKVDHKINDDWKINAVARKTNSGSETREHWVTIPSVPDAAGNVPRTIYTVDRETDVVNFDVNVQGKLELGQTKHNLVVGIDRQDASWEEDNFLYGYGAGGVINVYNPQYGNLNTAALAFATDRNDNEIDQVGIYIADQIDIGNSVVSLGVRHDKAKNRSINPNGTVAAESDESETTGRVGLMYRFYNGISPYISYSQAFSMNLGSDGVGGTLKPTKGDQKEVGVKYVSDAGDLEITAAYFDIEEKNRIQQGTTPGGVEQVGAIVDGFELEAKKRWNKFEAQIAYTDLSAKQAKTNTTPETRLPYVAEKTASLWGKYSVNEHFSVAAGARYTGDNVGFGGSPKVPSVTLFDANLAYDINSWSFSLSGKNLADKEYVSWCRGPGQDCGYGEKRTVLGNATYKF